MARNREGLVWSFDAAFHAGLSRFLIVIGCCFPLIPGCSHAGTCDRLKGREYIARATERTSACLGGCSVGKVSEDGDTSRWKVTGASCGGFVGQGAPAAAAPAAAVPSEAEGAKPRGEVENPKTAEAIYQRGRAKNEKPIEGVPPGMRATPRNKR